MGTQAKIRWDLLIRPHSKLSCAQIFWEYPIILLLVITHTLYTAPINYIDAKRMRGELGGM